jgi:hypothetical protein
MQPEQEGGDDAEVASPAADGPEEVGILVRAGAYLLAARENDVGFEQVVDRKPAFAGQMAEAAAQGEATHPRRGDDPTRRREPVLAAFGHERNDDRRPLLDSRPFSTLYRDC